MDAFSKSKTEAKLGNCCDRTSVALRQITEEANLHIRQTAEHRWRFFSPASYYGKRFLKNVALPKKKKKTRMRTFCGLENKKHSEKVAVEGQPSLPGPTGCCC